MSSGIKKIKAEKFWLELSKKTRKKSIPFRATIELTYRCNLKCVHCYITEDKFKKELSLNEICSILDQLADLGCLHLSITGGEIFIREDIFEILTYAKKKGFKFPLLTKIGLNP